MIGFMFDIPDLPPDRFLMLEELSKTGAEILVRAWDKVLDREVLLKAPGPVMERQLNRVTDRDLFLREARVMARLNHPGIGKVFEVLELSMGPVLVMEPLTGEPLAARLAREGPFTAEEVRGIGLAIADALREVHRAGAVHRGISPGNVYLTSDDRVLLTGFSFAKMSGVGHGTSLEHLKAKDAANPESLALPAYPAPEQLAGHAADARSDLFGLGRLLFLCLTGSEAFPPDRPGGAGDELRELNPNIPADLEHAVLKCLAPNPVERFQSANDLMTSLRAAPQELRGEPRTVGRYVWPAVTGAIALLALAFLAPRIWKPPAGRSGDTTGTRSVVEPEGGRAPSPGGSFQALYRNSRALLIGVGEAYAGRFPILPNAERDVRDLERRLETMSWEGWSVTTLIGPEATFDRIRVALATLSNAASPDDRVFVYYSGHGERHPRSGQSGWIIPADAVPLDADSTRKNWYRFDEFEKLFWECRAKHILVALDCCYSGIGVVATKSARTEPYRNELLTGRAHVLLASSRPNKPALDGPPGGHSPFAQAFLDALSDPGEPLTSAELAVMIQKKFEADGIDQALMGHHRETAPEMSEFVFFRRP